MSTAKRKESEFSYRKANREGWLVRARLAGQGRVTRRGSALSSITCCSHLFFFFFWLSLAACRILVPRPGIEPTCLVVEV